MSAVLVAGVYPPVPSRAARMTLAWAEHLARRDEPVAVVSPRPGAAMLTGAISGWRAGSVLRRLADERGARHLVLCLSPGVPFAEDRGALERAVTSWLLARALQALDRVELLLAEDPDVPGACLGPLWPHVQRVLVATEADRLVAERLGAPANRVEVSQVLATASERDERFAASSLFGADALASLTVCGPPEWLSWGERIRAALPRAVPSRLRHQLRRYGGRAVRFVLRLDPAAPLTGRRTR